ncbi:MAG TPA: hypothetical protein VFP72_13520 [Kineosporiaceae bacterium]|nr:hypothetical protein [Kineosporiaceae bacterium]
MSGVLLAAAAGSLVAACTAGSGSHPAANARGAAASASPTAQCPLGTWSVPASAEFAEMGLDTMTRGSVKATAGTVRVSFAADRTYTFTYDGVVLVLGDGSGSATVSGPVTGTWQVTGDKLTTAVTSSKVSVKVSVAGVNVTPSDALNRALQGGLPSTARVSCASGRLLTTVSAGAAAGRQVTFSAD